MAARRFKQMIINVKWKGKYYNIRAKSVKPTLKQDSEQYTATNSLQPYAVAVEGQSYEVDLSGIDPEHYPLFKEIYSEQNSSAPLSESLFNVTTYDYDNKKQLRPKDWFGYCIMTELGNETAEPFDIKCTALRWN